MNVFEQANDLLHGGALGGLLGRAEVADAESLKHLAFDTGCEELGVQALVALLLLDEGAHPPHQVAAVAVVEVVAGGGFAGDELQEHDAEAVDVASRSGVPGLTVLGRDVAQAAAHHGSGEAGSGLHQARQAAPCEVGLVLRVQHDVAGRHVAVHHRRRAPVVQKRQRPRHSHCDAVPDGPAQLLVNHELLVRVLPRLLHPVLWVVLCHRHASVEDEMRTKIQAPTKDYCLCLYLVPHYTRE